MKFVILVDKDGKNFENFQRLSRNKKQFLLDVSSDKEEEQECDSILNGIQKFSKSTSNLMLAKFSGKDEVVQQVGDESPEMIVSLSSNKKSKYYVEEPERLFLDLLTIFERGE